MSMRNVHDLECPQCKIRDEFYKKFNSHSRKDAPYFGVISYIKFVMSVSSNKSEKDFAKKDIHWQSNIYYLQLIHQRTVREQISKRLKPKSKECHTPLSEKFYFRKGTRNLLTVKKSESFSSESSRDVTIGSSNVGTCNSVDVQKCKFSKKRRIVKKVKTVSKEPRISTLKRKRWNQKKLKSNKSSDRSAKEPRIGTLKRKRWNLEKLKSDKSYEDDLFEEQKVKRLAKVPEDSDSSEDKITTPRWSVQVSPRELSPSPSYKDCYSPNELQNNRKSAEEYRYRRNKRKNVHIREEPEDDVLKEDPDTYKTLEKACDKLLKLTKIKKVECDSDEDYYFSDNAKDSD